MYFVVRTDLKMGGGKIASQTAHAAIMCYKKAARECPALLRGWEAQVWSLTQFYYVDFSQSRIDEKSAFSKNTQSRSAAS